MDAFRARRGYRFRAVAGTMAGPAQTTSETCHDDARRLSDRNTRTSLGSLRNARPGWPDRKSCAAMPKMC